MVHSIMAAAVLVAYSTNASLADTCLVGTWSQHAFASAEAAYGRWVLQQALSP